MFLREIIAIIPVTGYDMVFAEKPEFLGLTRYWEQK